MWRQTLCGRITSFSSNGSWTRTHSVHWNTSTIRVDLFASPLNLKVKIFYSPFRHPLAWATDALARNFLPTFRPLSSGGRKTTILSRGEAGGKDSDPQALPRLTQSGPVALSRKIFCSKSFKLIIRAWKKIGTYCLLLLNLSTVLLPVVLP